MEGFNLNKISTPSLKWCKDTGINYFYSPSIKSTQDLAKKEAFDLNTHLKIYITDYQTKGRGRLNNRIWISKAYDNFLSTWSWEFSGQKINTVFSEQIGQKVILACKKTWPEFNWHLKLPNDIYLNNKKVAGLLIDILNQGNKSRLLIGLGFNIYSSPENLKNNSTHLLKEKSTSLFWPQFLDELIKNWNACLK